MTTETSQKIKELAEEEKVECFERAFGHKKLTNGVDTDHNIFLDIWDTAQAPLIEYCEKLEKIAVINLSKQIDDIIIEQKFKIEDLEKELYLFKNIDANKALISADKRLEHLEKENQKLKKQIDFIFLELNQYPKFNLNPLSKRIFNKLRDSAGDKPSDDKLGNFGASPISSENKTSSERKKEKVE